MAITFELLGPVTVRRDGEQVPLGGPRQRALLALLLVEANRIVTTDRLIEELWPAEPPQSGPTVVQNQVWRLRKAVGADRIVTSGAGYALRVEAGELDVDRFRGLVERAAAADPPERARQLAEALSLWRGAALTDATETPTLMIEADRLEELRLAALEQRIDADLALGRHAAVVGELAALTAQHPLREALRARHILALYRCGRQAEALDVYRETRRLLADDLGLEPGVELRDLEQRILRHDPTLGVRRSAAEERTAPPERRAWRRARLLVPAVVIPALLLPGVAYRALSGSADATIPPPAVAEQPQTPVTIFDDFADGAYDPGRWHVIANGMGIETGERRGELELAFSDKAEPFVTRPFKDLDAHYGTQCRFPGDFDAEVDFRLLRWPHAEGLSLAFNAIYADVSLARVTDPIRGELLVARIGPRWTAKPVRGASGSVRIARRAGVATVYVRRGPEWAELASGPSTGTAVLGLQLIAQRRAWHRAARVAFDNFSVETRDLDCARPR